MEMGRLGAERLQAESMPPIHLICLAGFSEQSIFMAIIVV
jgi:hypothetical protein